jgi:hypothetical protein
LSSSQSLFLKQPRSCAPYRFWCCPSSGLIAPRLQRGPTKSRCGPITTRHVLGQQGPSARIPLPRTAPGFRTVWCDAWHSRVFVVSPVTENRSVLRSPSPASADHCLSRRAVPSRKSTLGVRTLAPSIMSSNFDWSSASSMKCRRMALRVNLQRPPRNHLLHHRESNRQARMAQSLAQDSMFRTTAI